jgi:hypothetical protein
VILFELVEQGVEGGAHVSVGGAHQSLDELQQSQVQALGGRDGGLFDEVHEPAPVSTVLACLHRCAESVSVLRASGLDRLTSQRISNYTRLSIARVLHQYRLSII